ncbi:MAG: RNA polymerase Rpb4 family protein [Sulfolobaceae archaeon]
MSSSSIIILEEHYIPYSVARKLLEDVIKSGTSSALIQRTYDYLSSIEKCDFLTAQKIMEELSSINELSEESRALIASLCPSSIDELRAILVIEGNKFIPTEVLEKILAIINKHVKK